MPALGLAARVCGSTPVSILAIEACSFSRDIRSVRQAGRGPPFPGLLALLGQPRVPVPICHFQKKIRNTVRIGI
jgi:hypothetical protein